MHARIILVWCQVLCCQHFAGLTVFYRMSFCEATQQSYSNFSFIEAAMAASCKRGLLLCKVPDLQLITRS